MKRLRTGAEEVNNRSELKVLVVVVINCNLNLLNALIAIENQSWRYTQSINLKSIKIVTLALINKKLPALEPLDLFDQPTR